MHKKFPHLDYCQNCGGPTPGNFCAECGQDSREHRVSMRLLLFGLWNDLFTFDSRFFRSFIPLLFRPGRLTREYIVGRRVRFIPPVRLYLFVSILFFFLVAVLFKGTPSTETADTAALVDSLTTFTAESDSMTSATAGIDLTIPAAPIDSIPVTEVENEVIALNSTGTSQVTLLGEEHEIGNEDFSAMFFSLSPKGMFVLLPIFAGLLALVYRRSRKLFIEHLIFSLHYHSYIFLLFILTMIFNRIFGWDWIWLITFVGFHVYLYLALKRVYRQGWRKTWLKHLLLTSAYNVVFLALLTLMTLGGLLLVVKAQDHPWLLGLIGG
ncbi:MAG: DUF3667 domain-containing protein [bacterium]|nr:DUF3667 domain-containing protein [bacterium]